MLPGAWVAPGPVATLPFGRRMRGSGGWCGTQAEQERLDKVAERYCTCGWLSPLRAGKPECDVHALFDDQRAVALLLRAYRMRARLVDAEWGGVRG
jgi:hypothetical protein